MCGIAGLFGPADPMPCLRRMTAALAHRGPEDEGYFTAQLGAVGIGLGHRRLAILDLTAAGRQPMISRNRRYVLAFNGEIFNYRELGQELSDELGGREAFRSATDTEVLLEACAAWGAEKALARLNGMFAFALWDSRRRELTLARDRCGEKPLVYYWDRHAFGFASELKALAGLHESRLDPEAVDAYFALGYVPAPLAVFRNCRKLPAGHLLRLCARGEGLAAPEVRRWWLPERVLPAGAKRGASRAGGRELRSLVSEAIRLRLRADVPVALALSGGIDSSIIAAECARQGASIHAFTVVLDGDSTDLPHARVLAAALKLPHEVIEARPDAAAGQMERFVQNYDEPFADSSALPSLALARALGGRYKVILNGDGGDEAFGGYPHYEHVGAKQVLKRAAAAAGLRDGSGSVGVYVQSKSTFRARERSGLLGRRAADTVSLLVESDGYLRQGALAGGALRRALWTDRHLYLANDLTYKMDIALGAFGMEGRAPFLDHRILEWSQGLRDSELVRGRQKKVLLREAFRGVVPAEILDRAKHGFGAPIGAWLAGPLKEMVEDLLPCPLLDRAAQNEASRERPARAGLLFERPARPGLYGQRLWTLVAFAHWARRWRATW